MIDTGWIESVETVYLPDPAPAVTVELRTWTRHAGIATLRAWRHPGMTCWQFEANRPDGILATGRALGEADAKRQAAHHAGLAGEIERSGR